MPTYFDDSLKAVATAISNELGKNQLESGVILRDSFGRLSFFNKKKLKATEKKKASSTLLEALGAYTRQNQAIFDIDDYGVEEILSDSAIRTLEMGEFKLRVIDRRIVGADWLRTPVIRHPIPPRYVFSSIKGGVGRSTALSIVAADLAAKGQKVLAIDLDIEAPGLGAILLTDETLPEFGLLDALVENGINGLDDVFLADMVGPSPLAGNNGRIDVIPVLGRRSLSNPANVLGKIARAYTEDVNQNGSVDTILDQIRIIVEKFSDPQRYDVILIDARAGLHETTASALFGLGAEIFLFGLDEPQTFQGFKILFSHLEKYVPSETLNSWLGKLTIVQGKAPAETSLRLAFKDSCQSIIRLIDAVDLENTQHRFEDEISDFSEIVWNDEISDQDVLPQEEISGPSIIAIIDDPRYKSFNPAHKRDLLEHSIYSSSYQEIIEKIKSQLTPSEAY